MSIDYRKYLPAMIKTIIIIAIGLFLYYLGLPIVKILSPFILASIIAMLIEPQVKFLQKRCKLGRKISSLISLIFSLLVFGTILTLIIYKIIIELVSLSSAIPMYFVNIDITNEINYFTTLAQKFYLSIPNNVTNLIESKLSESITAISGHITSFISNILEFVLNFIKVLPQSLIFVVITIISTYFISSDKHKIKKFIFNQFPESMPEKIQNLKNDLFFALIGFLKAQLIIIMISAFIASTGLAILGIQYALVAGIVIALAELIPVVGTGLIFIPWIIVYAISGNVFLAVGLLAVFLLGVIIRQIVEPKIIGVQIGLYPLVTLISIYVGLELFGIFGMILGPVIIITLRSLNKSNFIKLWKE